MKELEKLTLRLIKTICIVVGFAMPIETLLANAVDCNTNPTTFSGIISYDTSGTTNTFCELCGIGQVRIVVTNTTHEDMANFSVKHVFQSNELEYVPGSTNGGGAGDPVISGGGTTLTWTSAEIPALAQINGIPGHSGYNNVVITFQVRSRSGTEENLLNINRQVDATADYTYCPLTTNVAATAVSGALTLPLNEPIPTVVKLGRNVDASQGSGSYTSTVYGNINDDVIWRIQISNSGLAALQDLKFNDLMSNGNFQINYACPTEAEAGSITAANGIDPGGNNCIASSNNINNFIVDDTFGNPANDEPTTFIDVPAGGSTYIYLVGKINSSCNVNTTNTVSNLEWGCEVISPDGGITQTSTGASAGTSTSTLSSLVNNNGLQIQRALTGLNTNQPVGSRGLMTVTITNNAGGSIKNIDLTNTLPVQYVVDPTFTPTLTMNYAYGNYNGRIDTINWTNPAAAANPLGNTAPNFTLTSSTVHPNYADQLNMLRQGDVAVIRFRVVMIQSDHFDVLANLDTTPEVIGSYDPDNVHNTATTDQLSNKLDVTFNNFCNSTLQSLTYNDLFDAFPEDLDVSIPGGSVFILTNDPNQRLPLQVNLTNNGGANADNYQAYVTFGATMNVVTVPAGCSVTTNPPPLEVWDDPVDIPASVNTTIYSCNRGTIAPGATEALNFEVIKTTDAGRLAEDDLSFRADVVGEIVLSDNTLTGSGGLTLFSLGGALLDFPTVSTTANGGQIDNRANNYSLDAVRAKVIGFNLTKTQVGNCSENNPPPANPDVLVQIGEQCKVHIETGGWFGFQTPGFTYIAVQKIQVDDQLPNGQGFISTSIPVPASDASVKNITLNPPPAPLDEGTFNWTFNQVVPTERITIKDQWFRMDATTRILNDPIDTRAAPNVHAATSSNVLVSTFEAVFNDVVNGDVTYTLGPSTIGYPSVAARTVNLTITEPNITIVKEVCNETLYGVGTGCSNFVTAANNGDTQDAYIYKITVTNEAANSGFARAPAYDVTLTDTLDASDLMLINSFATDGLDNDGDGLIDAADSSESTISDNIINNAIPAVITSSYTHSAALLKIDPGVSNGVTYYYRVDPDDAIAPQQILTNSVLASYDSLYGQSGNQTEPTPLVESNNSEAGGARVYSSSAVTATVQILPLQAQPKEITRLSNTTIGGSPQAVSVGEEIEYQLRTLIPVANLRSFKIRDELPAGISCSEAAIVDLDAAPYSDAGFSPGGKITPSCANNLVEWDFGDQELTQATGNSLFDFAIRFIARVDNSAGVNNTNVISNGAPATNVVMSYINEASTLITQNYNQIDILIQEPNIVLTKAFETVANDAGDIITVTVTATNNGTATAYNLNIFDDLAAASNLTFLNNVAGTDPPDNIDIITFGANRPVFSWNSSNADYAIAPTETKTFTFEIQVDLAAQPREILDNTIQASWQSLPSQSTALNTTGLIGADGSTTGMRNGAIPNAANTINDYETTATTSSTVPAVTVTKTDLDAAQLPEVGVHKNYQIVINLPEGTTNNLVINDNLNYSDISYVLENNSTYDITYTFSGITSINSGLTPLEGNLISPAPVDGATNTVTWNFGTVVTATEDDTLGTPAITPSITINYYARIDNSVTTNRDDKLQNQVITNYRHGETGGTEALTNTTPIQTVTESLLTLTKTATLITAMPITSGDIIEYVVTISNAGGNAIAYDLNIADTLPANLGLYTSFTPTATIGGVPLVGFTALPTNSPNGPLIWGRGNADNSIDIPAGATLILTYRMILQAGAEAGIDYITSTLVDWTSLNGASNYERTGAGCPTIIAPNNYCVGPVTSKITTVDTNTLMKAVIYDSFTPTNDATVRIGDYAIYRLSLNLQEGTTRNVNVQDVLPAGLSFDKIISINGDAVADYDAPSSGAGSNFSYSTITPGSLPSAGDVGTLNFSIGTVVNDPLGDATTDTLVIEYQVIVLNNTLTQIPTTTLTNTATLQFIDGNGVAVIAPTRLEKTANITVLQPILTMTKTAASALAEIGTPVNYTLKVQNTGAAPAYDATIVDTLPTFAPAVGGMCDTIPVNISARIYLADGITPATAAALIQGTDYTVNYSGCTLTLVMQTADSVLAATYNLIVTYDAELDSDTPHNSALINIAGTNQWFSQDTAGAGAIGNIQTYSRTITNGTVGTLDHEDAYTVTSDTPTITIEKRVINVTTSQDPGINASPGDTLRYSIYITNTSNVELFDFNFTDDLDALNAIASFSANTINLITVPAGADTTNTNLTGGAKGTGLVDIRKLTLGKAGSGNETSLIVFEVQLAKSISDATTVYNQGHMITNGLDFPTDDPNIVGAANPTETLINSAPAFRIQKISTDLTGDPTILESGDTLRYTITVKNIGNENTLNSILRDQLPANTTYIANSTTLNGITVNEPTVGVLPLQVGILVNAPENTTAGIMRADASATTLNVATIIFDVTINANVVNGTIISNQAYLSADGVGSGAIADQPSDDPDTITPNDPTLDIIGNQPFVDALKTVSIVVDNGTIGILDPNDVIRYTITLSNIGAADATVVTFKDAVPVNTTYVADSVMLNGLPVAQPDGGVSPLIAGINVSSSNLTPPLPMAGAGIISRGESAVITFDVKVDALTAVGTVISNQGFVDSYELPIEPTDSDGIDSNGDQPTLIVVGNAQLLSIVKSVAVVGGGPAVAGGQLEYRVRVTNISTVPANTVYITDDLDSPVAGQVTFVAGSALLDGLVAGVSFIDPVITANYSNIYGDLAPGASTELVFRVQINNMLPIGTTITNTATVYWNTTQNASASISIDVGAVPGVANLNGTVWHDANFNNTLDSGERVLSGWLVDIYRNNILLGTVTSDTNGIYSINGLLPNYIGTEKYEIKFRAPGSTSTTALLGYADSPTGSGFLNGLQKIYDIVLYPGTNTINMNLPIDPNGVVYNSIERTAVSGATISLLNAGSGIELSSSCFDDVNQQNQITTTNGYYKFDINFSQADCVAGSNYLIRITPPVTGYSQDPSVVILPQTTALTAALDVPNCPGSASDALSATATICEAQTSEFAPVPSVTVGAGTKYYLHLTLDNGTTPDDSQLFNNHLSIDPVLNTAVSISKTTSMVNVKRSQLVPYTITVKNKLTVALRNANVIDNLPAGFKYIRGSARLNGVAREPTPNGLQLTWSNVDLIPDEILTFKFLLIIGAAVSEGEYINRAHVIDTLTNTSASGVATATVRVIPDPAFDCTDVIGKVFDDENLNGYQDKNERGIAGARVVTVKGLNVTTDKYGRFHLTCAVVADRSRGSNFIIKLDDRSLPSGYRVTTENPRVQRATRGKMLKFNFGAAIHRIVSLDMADGVFEKGNEKIKSQWKSRIDLLIKQLLVKPSILHLSYLADIETATLVDDRLERIQNEIYKKWKGVGKYKLNIETEIFWRRGGPPNLRGLN